MKGRGLSFWQRVEKTDSCWLWLSFINDRGYGQVWHDGNNKKAHRVAYELAKGPIPEGYEIDHLCKIRHCVNPDHLEPVTHYENCQRGDLGIRNRQKTHCKWGHEFTVENTYIKKYNGLRDCIACRQRRVREWQARNK
jgi:hypothetical protein